MWKYFGKIFLLLITGLELGIFIWSLFNGKFLLSSQSFLAFVILLGLFLLIVKAD